MVVVWVGYLLAPGLLLSQTVGPNNPLQPKWHAATLTVGERSFPVWRIRDSWEVEKRIGNYLVRIQNSKIEVRDFGTLQPLWSETAKNDGKFLLVGDDLSSIYFYENRWKEDDSANELVILRREISTGQKLSDILIPLTDEEKKLVTKVVGSVVRADSSFWLTESFERSSFSLKQKSFRLTRFSKKQDWSIAFPSNGLPRSLREFAPTSRNVDQFRADALIDMDKQLLVSAGPCDDLLAIHPITGKILWKLPKIWEFRQAYVGGIWNPRTINRYGDCSISALLGNPSSTDPILSANPAGPDSPTQASASPSEEMRKHIQEQLGWIIGGPFAIRKSRHREDWSIIVLSAIAEKYSEWPSELADTVAYELNYRGDVNAMIKLPHLPDQGSMHALHDRVVGHSIDTIQFELFPTRSADKKMFGDNPLLRLNWVTEGTTQDRDVWLQQDASSNNPSIYFKSFAFRLKEGGFVIEEGVKQFQHPIVWKNHENASSGEMQVTLPFDGKLITSLKNSYPQICEVGYDGVTLSVVMEAHNTEPQRLDFQIPIADLDR